MSRALALATGGIRGNCTNRDLSFATEGVICREAVATQQGKVTQLRNIRVRFAPLAAAVCEVGELSVLTGVIITWPESVSAYAETAGNFLGTANAFAPLHGVESQTDFSIPPASAAANLSAPGVGVFSEFGDAVQATGSSTVDAWIGVSAFGAVANHFRGKFIKNPTDAELVMLFRQVRANMLTKRK